MTILRDISFLWSMLHVVALFLLFFEPRCSWRKIMILSFVGAGTLLSVNTLIMFWMGHGIIMSAAFFTCTLPTLLLFFLLSKYRDGRFFFLFCLTDTCCFWILQITNFLDRLTGDTYVVMLITRLIAFPAAELLFWRCLRRPYRELQSRLNSGWWLFAAVGAVYYLLIMVTSVPVGAPMPDLAGTIRILLVLLLMPLTYLTVFHSLWRQMQLYESSQQMELQRRDYEIIRQKMELGRIFRHDTRHHLMILEGLLQQENVNEARRYIQELSGRLTLLTQTAWCANSAVNAVLAAYIAQAEEIGCSVETEVHIPAELPYGEMGLCVILANTLENAVNACQDSREGQRLIRLKLELTENRRFILDMDNPCPQPVSFGPDGLPVGPQREGHGLGLRSVQGIAGKYGGLLRCRWEEGRFFLRVVLFPPPGGG